ncbi:hypothetical protein AVEN_253761-1 [Araneus ventricosus]|uniref:Retrovirus-related Pol polyprotein from transposon TNT 1-94 n=1 Tax=Araneus ventricosus TaxID=182803 RepID=A0A4Y2KZP8_ARAVE|nr:hypothetical protein AVEN_253761-1 [Araneus ventricosus]
MENTNESSTSEKRFMNLRCGGIQVKPELIDGNAESREACSKWTETEEKAKTDLILCISTAELKQVKNCVTSRNMWIKLEEIYQSKGPSRKATLLKSLIQLKIPDTGIEII